MTPLANFSLAECDFGDQRLTKRAIKIGEALSLKYGQPLSQVLGNASDLKRTYEFLTNPQTTFNKAYVKDGNYTVVGINQENSMTN